MMNNSPKTPADMRNEYKEYKWHPGTKMYGEIVPQSQLKNPDLVGLKTYADEFGLDTSVANLQSKFDALTRREFERKNAEYLQSENAYYQNMAAQNAQYQTALQDAASQALATGASRGMQFANQFAAQNALAEQNSTGALDLAVQRNNLKAEEAEAYTQNAVNAEDTIRNQNLKILEQAIADRANEVQRYAADASLESQNNLSRVQNYQFNMAQALEQHLAEQGYSLEERKAFLDALTSRYVADSNFAGTKYSADASLAGTKYSANANKNTDSENQPASADDILAAYTTAKNNNNHAQIAFLESEHPWLKDAYNKQVEDNKKKSGGTIAQWFRGYEKSKEASDKQVEDNKKKVDDAIAQRFSDFEKDPGGTLEQWFWGYEKDKEKAQNPKKSSYSLEYSDGSWYYIDKHGNKIESQLKPPTPVSILPR